MAEINNDCEGAVCVIPEKTEKFMLEKGRIHIWGHINEITAAHTIEKLEYCMLNQVMVVKLMIHSMGGSVDDALAIIDIINECRTYGMSIITVNMGMCYSAAAAILSMGSHRIAKPNSSTMLHPCQYSLSGDSVHNQERTNTFIKFQTEAFDKMIAKACKKNIRKYRKDTENGLWLTAEAAKNYQVVDEVGHCG